MKKLVSILLVLSLLTFVAVSVAEGAENQMGVYIVYNETGEKVTELYFTRQTYIDAMSRSSQNNAVRIIVSLIEKNMKIQEKKKTDKKTKED